MLNSSYSHIKGSFLKKRKQFNELYSFIVIIVLSVIQIILFLSKTDSQLKLIKSYDEYSKYEMLKFFQFIIIYALMVPNISYGCIELIEFLLIFKHKKPKH